MTQAELDYCRANASDPFITARIETHKRVGIANANDYSADEHWETATLPEGYLFSDGSNTYQRRAYRNVRRP